MVPDPMATYAIGDIQGCHAEFLALLETVAFDSRRDRLWLTGDLVNRGPHSLAVLREVMALRDRVTVVLGNHDLHLLACALSPGIKPCRRDTLAEVLAAPDRDELLAWLRQQPLFHYDAELGYAMVHAGLPPQWDLDLTRHCAAEVETVVRGDSAAEFFAAMYGNEPACWNAALSGLPRLRFITNCLTRIRYCDANGKLDLNEKSAADNSSALKPWFALPNRASRGLPILFGHWSTLRLTNAECLQHGVWPLDTGAVWGGQLSAMRLEDGAWFSVKSSVGLAIE